jgi:hypothetical protein
MHNMCLTLDCISNGGVFIHRYGDFLSIHIGHTSIAGQMLDPITIHIHKV